jgi:predicted Holliday junction resolvase-like endonuclease
MRMSTVAIVVLAVIVVAVIALVALAARRRRLDSRRTQARDMHREAHVRGLKAERVSAEAEQRAHTAKREKRFARDHAERARELDPDSTDEHQPVAAGRDEDRRR